MGNKAILKNKLPKYSDKDAVKFSATIDFFKKEAIAAIEELNCPEENIKEDLVITRLYKNLMGIVMIAEYYKSRLHIRLGYGKNDFVGKKVEAILSNKHVKDLLANYNLNGDIKTRLFKGIDEVNLSTVASAYPLRAMSMVASQIEKFYNNGDISKNMDSAVSNNKDGIIKRILPKKEKTIVLPKGIEHKFAKYDLSLNGIKSSAKNNDCK